MWFAGTPWQSTVNVSGALMAAFAGVTCTWQAAPRAPGTDSVKCAPAGTAFAGTVSVQRPFVSAPPEADTSAPSLDTLLTVVRPPVKLLSTSDATLSEACTPAAAVVSAPPGCPGSSGMRLGVLAAVV